MSYRHKYIPTCRSLLCRKCCHPCGKKRSYKIERKCPFFLVSYHMEGALLLVNLVFNRHALRVFCGFLMIIIRLVLSRDVRGETKSKILVAG